MEILVLLLFVIIIAVVVYKLFTYWNISKIFFGRGKNTPRIFTQEPWISDIISGKKTVEARIGTADKYEDLIGKTVKIVGGGKKVIATVTAVRHYKDLDSYLQKEGWEKVAPHVKSEKAAKDAYMEITNKAGEKVYENNRVKEKGGIIALEFKIQKDKK